MYSVPRFAPVLIAVLLLGLGAVDAVHGAAILLSDQRQISAEASVSIVNDEGEQVFDSDSAQSTSPSPFEPWTDGVLASASLPGVTSDAVASQSSSVTPTLFTAEMFSDIIVNGGVAATALAASSFQVAFELTTPHSFVLTGFGSAFPPIGGRRGAHASLSFGSHDFTGGELTGVLDPGVYALDASTFAGVNEDIGPGEFFASAALVFEFALTELAQVPEPSVFLLLGAAVVAAAWFGRRQIITRVGDR